MMTLVKLFDDSDICERLDSLMIRMGSRHWIGNLTNRVIDSLLRDISSQPLRNGIICIIKKDISQSKAYVCCSGKIVEKNIYEAFEKVLAKR